MLQLLLLLLQNTNKENKKIPPSRVGTVLPPRQILLQLPEFQRRLHLHEEWWNLSECNPGGAASCIIHCFSHSWFYFSGIICGHVSHFHVSTSQQLVGAQRSDLGPAIAEGLWVSWCKRRCQQSPPRQRRWCCPPTSAHPHSAEPSGGSDGAQSSHRLWLCKAFMRISHLKNSMWTTHKSAQLITLDTSHRNSTWIQLEEC